MHRFAALRACVALSANANAFKQGRLYATNSLIYETYGPPSDVLKLQTRDLPSVGPHQALVEFLAVRRPPLPLSLTPREDRAIMRFMRATLIDIPTRMTPAGKPQWT